VWIANADSENARYDWSIKAKKMKRAKKRELATERARLFPSTYEIVSAIARERHTSIAHVIDEWARPQVDRKK